MSASAGDLFISIPSPALRRILRQMAVDTDRPIRFIVTDILLRGLSEQGYDTATVEYPPAHSPRVEAADNRERTKRAAVSA